MNSIASFESKTALVTGATNGIGRELARGLAKGGATVLAGCRSISRFERLQGELASSESEEVAERLVPAPADLESGTAVDELARRLVDDEIGIDLLFLNAGIHDVPPEFIAAQIDAVFSDLKVGAVKIGMLSRPETIAVVAAGLDRHKQTKVVLDPVMAASSGDKLLQAEAVETLRRLLLPRALVLTPNLAEAAALLGTQIAANEDEMRDQGKRLIALGAKAVLIKGGHGGGPESVDLLVEPSSVTRLAAPRFATRNTHGTGCTLSSAIAAGLAKGMELNDAVRAAKSYVTNAIAAADRLSIGSGRGPVHHFYRWW